MYDSKSYFSFQNDGSPFNIYSESPSKYESLNSVFLPRSSTLSVSYEGDSYKNNDFYSLFEIESIDNLKNNFDDEEFNINYTIELTRQELELRLKKETDNDMRLFCNYFL